MNIKLNNFLFKFVPIIYLSTVSAAKISCKFLKKSRFFKAMVSVHLAPIDMSMRLPIYIGRFHAGCINVFEEVKPIIDEVIEENNNIKNYLIGSFPYHVNDKPIEYFFELDIKENCMTKNYIHPDTLRYINYTNIFSLVSYLIKRRRWK